jgi:hypothetical protein
MFTEMLAGDARPLAYVIESRYASRDGSIQNLRLSERGGTVLTGAGGNDLDRTG